VADEQFNELIVPTGTCTVTDKVHVWPPMFKAKLAVPEPDGVPVIA
jgi:hypothetical protein